MSDIQPTTDTSLDVEDDGEDHANEVRVSYLNRIYSQIKGKIRQVSRKV